MIKIADIRHLDGKVRPTIGGPMAVYIRDLLALGCYGERETSVVRALVQDGICRAIESGLIKPRDFSKRGNSRR